MVEIILELLGHLRIPAWVAAALLGLLVLFSGLVFALYVV